MIGAMREDTQSLERGVTANLGKEKERRTKIRKRKENAADHGNEDLKKRGIGREVDPERRIDDRNVINRRVMLKFNVNQA